MSAHLIVFGALCFIAGIATGVAIAAALFVSNILDKKGPRV